MRVRPYLSPSSLTLWENSREDFYLKYLSDSSPDEEPQNLAMAIGSSFDAHVKAFLHEGLFGKGADPAFALDAIFEAQVQPQHREVVREAGSRLLEIYRSSGAVSALMVLLGKTVGKPRFEMDVRGTLHSGRDPAILGGIPFRVKPDLFFVTERARSVIFDWKVTGWTSKGGASPLPGYVQIRGAGGVDGCHKLAALCQEGGILIDEARNLEKADRVWARQLAIGAWMCGEEVGSDFLAIVHQLVCRPTGVRIAEHNTTISQEFQQKTMELARSCWETLQSGHIFQDVSREESDARCALLDGRRETLASEVKGNDGLISPMGLLPTG